MTLTKEQREEKAAAYAAMLEDKNVLVDLSHVTTPDHYTRLPAGNIGVGNWHVSNTHIRLAQPAPTSIPWHNPEGVTEEQLERDKGWRFATKCEHERGHCETWTSLAEWEFWDERSKNWITRIYPNLSTVTVRTKLSLPAKYAHLEEAKEFAARSAFAAYKLNDGERLEWRGKAWKNEQRADFLSYLPDTGRVMFHRDDLSTGCPSFYYAEIIREETARDVARRLLKDVPQKEGHGPWEFLGRGKINVESGYCYILFMPVSSKWIDNSGPLHGKSTSVFYARARKLEPELVPYTMETFPRGYSWIREFEYREFLVTCVDQYGVYSGTSFWTFETLLSMERLNGTTWRKCGREAK